MAGRIKSWGSAGAVHSILRPLIVGVVSGCAMIVLLLYIAAFLISLRHTIPEGMLGGITTAILCISALTSGAVAAVLAGERGLIYGIACTVLLAIVILIAGTCIYGVSYTASALIKSCMMILCGAVSGVFVVNRKRKIKF